MRNLTLYFLLAYGISWFIWSPLYLPKLGFEGLPVIKYHHYLGSFGPMIAAFIMMYSLKGGRGLRELWSRMWKWRVPWYWYAASVFLPLLIFVVASLAALFIDKEPFSLSGFGVNKEFAGIGVFGYFVINLLTFGFGEETGWRGFALPVLQRRFTALLSTLLLTIGWACWHLPAFLYRPSYSNMSPAMIFGFVYGIFVGSIVLTWLFNSSKGSILVVAIFHAMIEIIFISDSITDNVASYETILLTLVAIGIIFIARPKDLSAQKRIT